MGAVNRLSQFLDQLRWTVKHPDWAWYAVGQYRQLKKDRERLAKTLASMGFLATRRGQEPSDWDWGIGAALHLAEQLSIELHEGACSLSCYAVLEPEYWVKGRSTEDFPKWCYRLFGRKKPEAEKRIEAWSMDPEIAIAECIINAKKAGVI